MTYFHNMGFMCVEFKVNWHNMRWYIGRQSTMMQKNLCSHGKPRKLYLHVLLQQIWSQRSTLTFPSHGQRLRKKCEFKNFTTHINLMRFSNFFLNSMYFLLMGDMCTKFQLDFPDMKQLIEQIWSHLLINRETRWDLYIAIQIRWTRGYSYYQWIPFGAF